MEALMQARSSMPTDAVVPAKREERLHRLMLAVVLYWACAIYVDAYHHAHEGFRIESFFILEHLPLYAGWLAACALLAIYYLQSARLGLPRATRLPSAYWLVAVGAVGYGLAGGLDMLWHSAFGFEQNLAVTWSPSHLALKTADFVVLAGLLRHSLAHRGPDDSRSLRAALPLLIPMAIVLWYAMWTTWYTNPLTADWASGGALVSHLDAFDYLEYGSGAGMVAGTLGMLWNVVLVVPFLIVPLARWSLPVGSITIMVSLYAVIMTASVDTLIFLPAIIGGAILGDVLWAWIRRTGRSGQPVAYAMLGAVVPLAQGMGYFATVATLPAGIVWPVHLWAGVLVMSVAVGGWLGYLAAGRPAALPVAGSAAHLLRGGRLMRLLAPFGLTLILSTVAIACNDQAAVTTGPTVPAAASTPVPDTLAPALSLPKAGIVAFVIETGATNRLIYIDQSGIHEVPMAVADATLGNPAVAGPDSIVFNSQRAGAQHIFRTSLDGHVTQLTSGDDAQDRAVVSPDGSMIAYTTFNETRELGLRVANADGTNVRVVTPGGPPGAHGGDDQPTFSPDGKWLAFVRIDPNVEQRAGIFVIRIDGTGERRLTDDDLDAGHPRWSPDGTKILYGQHVDATEFVSQPLSVVDVASGVSTPLADARDGGGAFDGDWSPDGTQMIYVYFIPGWNHNELRVANPDGTGARTMWVPDANDGGGVDRPDWGG